MADCRTYEHWVELRLACQRFAWPALITCPGRGGGLAGALPRSALHTTAGPELIPSESFICAPCGQQNIHILAGARERPGLAGHQSVQFRLPGPTKSTH